MLDKEKRQVKGDIRMNNKYIIKNCPAIYGIFLDGCKKDHYEDGTVLCKDCTDCVMKQIVDKCKKYIENYNDKVFHDEDDVKVLIGKVMLSQFILSELLDIQEVE